MKRTNRIGCFLLCLVMCMGLAPMPASAADGVAINSTNFPDKAFRTYIKEEFDQNSDGSLSAGEIEDATDIDVEGMEISSLTGLKHFPYLETLCCGDNLLTTLDLSGVSRLQYLDCCMNELKSLKLTNLSELYFLDCDGNLLKSLNLSGNPDLMTLFCFDNQLTTLNLANNPCLTELWCSDNMLTALDVTANTRLEQLDISGNSIKKLDIHTAPALVKTVRKGEKTVDDGIVTYEIENDYNNEYFLLIANTKTELYLGENVDGIAVNEKNFPDSAFREYVRKHFDTDNNGGLDEDEIAVVTEIRADGLNIASLQGIGYFPKLKILDCSGNRLMVLDLTKNTALRELYCGGNQLISLDVSQNADLTALLCAGNRLTALDLSGNTALRVLDCSANELTRLDIWMIPGLLSACSGTREESGGIVKYTAGEDSLTVDSTVKVHSVAPCAVHTPGQPTAENEIAPTCAAEGRWEEVVYCAVCDEELSRETRSIEKLPHTEAEPERENETPATCMAEGGYDSVVYCAVCRAELSRERVSVEKAPHTPGEPVRENEVPSTCIDEGSYEEVVYCSLCGEELLREGRVIEKAPHTPGEPVREKEILPTCTEDGSYEQVIYCSVCGEELSRESCTETAPGHEWGPWVTQIPATEDEEGLESRTCQRDASHTEQRPIPRIPLIPVITGQPGSVTAVSGHTVTFTVTARGRTLTYQWYSLKKGETDWIPMEGQIGAELSLTAEKELSGSRYRCEITDRDGSALSDEAVLTVLTKPRVTTQPKSTSVKLGKTAVFKVKATGGGLKYQWYYRKPGTKKWLKVKPNGTSATLKVQVWRSMSGYRYRCLVKNAAGKVYTKSAKLTIK